MHLRCGGALPFAGATQRRHYRNTIESTYVTKQGYPYHMADDALST